MAEREAKIKIHTCNVDNVQAIIITDNMTFSFV